MTQRRDIEIYIQACPMEPLLNWLARVFGKANRTLKEGTVAIYRFQTASEIVPVIVTPPTDAGGWTSVWFNSPHTPWATDLDCARQAAAELGCTVRCERSEQSGKQPAKMFVNIAAGQETLVAWTQPD
jgi:hypothetical protein